MFGHTISGKKRQIRRPLSWRNGTEERRALKWEWFETRYQPLTRGQTASMAVPAPTTW